MSRHEEGFSLVEVIIAMFLLAVLSLAVLPLIIRASSLSTANQDTVSAIGVASAQLSAVRAAFPNDPDETGTCGDLEDAVAELEAAAASPGLSVAFESIDCVRVAGPEAVTVAVVVDGDRTSSRVELTTSVLVSGP